MKCEYCGKKKEEKTSHGLCEYCLRVANAVRKRIGKKTILRFDLSKVIKNVKTK